MLETCEVNGFVYKQPVSNVKDVVFDLPVIQASVEKTFSGLRYILNELRLELKEDIIEAILFQCCNTLTIGFQYN